MARVVVDTNVVIAGMLSGAGAPAEVLLRVLRGEDTLLVDDRILAEYDEVSGRKRFAFDQAERRALLDVLRVIGEPVVAAPFPGELPDGDDRMFVEVAIGGAADVLITGDTKHFALGRRLPFAVRTPRQYVDEVRGEPNETRF